MNAREISAELSEQMLTRTDFVDSLKNELYSIAFISKDGSATYAANIEASGKGRLKIEMSTGEVFSIIVER